MLKKGQITIFVIIAILIVVAIGITFVARSSLNKNIDTGHVKTVINNVTVSDDLIFGPYSEYESSKSPLTGLAVSGEEGIEVYYGGNNNYFPNIILKNEDKFFHTNYFVPGATCNGDSIGGYLDCGSFGYHCYSGDISLEAYNSGSVNGAICYKDCSECGCGVYYGKRINSAVFQPLGQICGGQEMMDTFSVSSACGDFYVARPTNEECDNETMDYEDSPFGWNPAKPYKYAGDLGVRWTRPFGYFFWWSVQPDINKKEYYFARDFDGGKNNLLNVDKDLRIMPEGMYGMGLIAINLLSDSVEHRRTSENSWAPINKEAYSDYIKALVERYDGDNNYGCVVSAPDCYVVGDSEYPALETITAITNKPVKYWQITNEPILESPPEVGLTGLSELTRLSYIAMKQADPDAKLILGSYSSFSANGSNSDFDKRYLPFLQELNGSYADIIDIHLYGDAFGDYLFKDETAGESFIDHIKLSLGNLFPNNVSIWMTETGTHSGSIIYLAKLDPQSEQRQAGDYVKRYAHGTFKGIEKLFGCLSFVEGTWYDPDDFFSKTELIYEGNGTDDLGAGVKKLSYYSYKLMTEKLEGSDWDNIQEVYNSENVYAYKFINKQTQKLTYVAWWDYWNESTLATKTVQIPVSLTENAKITEAIPAYENGLLLQQSGINYPNFFNKGTTNIVNENITLTLGQSPVYIEETTENLGNYVPHVWNQVSATTDSIIKDTEKISYCGDGYCDGLAGEKTTCPSDCVIKK